MQHNIANKMAKLTKAMINSKKKNSMLKKYQFYNKLIYNRFLQMEKNPKCLMIYEEFGIYKKQEMVKKNK